MAGGVARHARPAQPAAPRCAAAALCAAARRRRACKGELGVQQGPWATAARPPRDANRCAGLGGRGLSKGSGHYPVHNRRQTSSVDGRARSSPAESRQASRLPPPRASRLSGYLPSATAGPPCRVTLCPPRLPLTRPTPRCGRGACRRCGQQGGEGGTGACMEIGSRSLGSREASIS